MIPFFFFSNSEIICCAMYIVHASLMIIIFSTCHLFERLLWLGGEKYFFQIFSSNSHLVEKLLWMGEPDPEEVIRSDRGSVTQVIIHIIINLSG